jgi:hypothetical protein
MIRHFTIADVHKCVSNYLVTNPNVTRFAQNCDIVVIQFLDSETYVYFRRTEDIICFDNFETAMKEYFF